MKHLVSGRGAVLVLVAALIAVFFIYDLGQYLTPIHPGQVQVQEDEVWVGDLDIRPLLLEEGHRFDAIADYTAGSA